MSEIIQNYGMTVTPELYIRALQGHQYIPQADQCIEDLIKRFCEQKPLGYRSTILDLGCGPGRITHRLGLSNSYKVGLDISPEFIDYAWKKLTNVADPFISFQQTDFCSNEEIKFFDGKILREFDVIIMQGVMHHVHGKDRHIWLKKCHSLLKPDGILIIGDEFIKDYNSDGERISNVCKFYMHIIDEARKGGFDELAKEEAKNLIDDVLSGKKGAGFANKVVLQKIWDSAKMNNESFYNHGYMFNQNISGHLIPWLERECADLATHDQQDQSFNRGDFKVSILRFTDEITDYGFVSRNRYTIGPVDQLGGMGVLMFTKK